MFEICLHYAVTHKLARTTTYIHTMNTYTSKYNEATTEYWRLRYGIGIMTKIWLQPLWIETKSCSVSVFVCVYDRLSDFCSLNSASALNNRHTFVRVLLTSTLFSVSVSSSSFEFLLHLLILVLMLMAFSFSFFLLALLLHFALTYCDWKKIAP